MNVFPSPSMHTEPQTMTKNKNPDNAGFVDQKLQIWLLTLLALFIPLALKKKLWCILKLHIKT